MASHTLLHSAEGDLYLSALQDAAEAHALPVVLAPPKSTVAAVAPHLGVPPEELAARLGELRREVGAPWQADHKAATAAALLALRTR